MQYCALSSSSAISVSLTDVLTSTTAKAISIWPSFDAQSVISSISIESIASQPTATSANVLEKTLNTTQSIDSSIVVSSSSASIAISIPVHEISQMTSAQMVYSAEPANTGSATEIMSSNDAVLKSSSTANPDSSVNSASATLLLSVISKNIESTSSSQTNSAPSSSYDYSSTALPFSAKVGSTDTSAGETSSGVAMAAAASTFVSDSAGSQMPTVDNKTETLVILTPDATLSASSSVSGSATPLASLLKSSNSESLSESVPTLESGKTYSAGLNVVETTIAKPGSSISSLAAIETTLGKPSSSSSLAAIETTVAKPSTSSSSLAAIETTIAKLSIDGSSLIAFETTLGKPSTSSSSLAAIETTVAKPSTSSSRLTVIEKAVSKPSTTLTWFAVVSTSITSPPASLSLRSTAVEKSIPSFDAYLTAQGLLTSLDSVARYALETSSSTDDEPVVHSTVFSSKVVTAAHGASILNETRTASSPTLTKSGSPHVKPSLFALIISTIAVQIS